MTKDDLLLEVEKWVKEVRKGDDSLSSLPISEGVKLTFLQDPDKLITLRKGRSRNANGTLGDEFSYYVFNTKEGYTIPFKHIAFVGNGLNLQPEGYKDAIQKMVSLCLDSDPLRVTVKDILTFKTSYGENRFYVFRVLE